MRALYTDSEPMRAWHITKQGNKRQHGNKQFQNKRHKQDKTFIIYHSLKDTTITKLHRINPVYIHLILWFIFCGSLIFPISLNCHLFFKKKNCSCSCSFCAFLVFYAYLSPTINKDAVIPIWSHRNLCVFYDLAISDKFVQSDLYLNIWL